MLKKFFTLLPFLLLLLLESGCNTLLFSQKTDWNRQPLLIQSLNLFNQRSKTIRGFQGSWKGDWFLRRRRLFFLDQEITKTMPNVILFQEMLAKSSSPSDSDASILEKSSLAYFDEFITDYKKHRDTEEIEQAGTYLRVEGSETEEIILGHELMWDIGKTGYLLYQKIFIKEDPFYIFNIKLPRENKNPERLYAFLKRTMTRALDGENRCYNYILLAGFFGDFDNSPQLQQLARDFNLTDTGAKLCEVESHECYTESSANPVLNSSSFKNQFRRSERIYIHKSALVSSAQLVYNKQHESLPNFKLKYKLYKLSPSLYYGWQAKVQLPSCLTRN